MPEMGYLEQLLVFQGFRAGGLINPVMKTQVRFQSSLMFRERNFSNYFISVCFWYIRSVPYSDVCLRQVGVTSLIAQIICERKI